MKHTPGPWKFDGVKSVTGYEITGQIGGVHVPVAYTQGADKPNAYLIAAAPKMLATLKKVHAQLVAWGKQNGMDFQLISAVEDTISEAEPGWRV